MRLGLAPSRLLGASTNCALLLLGSTGHFKLVVPWLIGTGTLHFAFAPVIFVIGGHLIVDAVYMLALGTLVGGWLGTLLIRRLSPDVVRVMVIAVRLATTVRLAPTT